MRPILLLVIFGLFLMASACSGGDKDSFRNVDHDKNGKVSYEELLFVFPDVTQETYRNMDTDGDGLLSESEYAMFLKSESMKAAAGKAATAASPAAGTQAPQGTAPAKASQPAIPYKGEEVIEIPAPAPEAPRSIPAKTKPEKGKKDHKQKNEAASREQPTQYTVVRGDNLTKIAQRYGVTVEDITRANGNMSPDTLRDGQVLTIPARP